jgi:membrane fusion protein, multidrug efflux system
MMHTPSAGTGLARVGAAGFCLLLLATIVGCSDTGEGQPRGGQVPPRPVKTLLVSASASDDGIELPGPVRQVPPVDLSFEKVSGQIVELPIAGHEGLEVQKGELLAQIDPKGFTNALHSAEDNLREAYSALDLARAEDERMQKMKGINPSLVSESMLKRTAGKLEEAEAHIDSLEPEVQKAEDQLEHTSLRAPFDGIVTRCLARPRKRVQAGETILSLQDTSHLEVLVDAPPYLMAAVQEAGAKGISATARFPTASDEDFPLSLKGTEPVADTGGGGHRLVLEMGKPKGIDLPPDTIGTVRIKGAEDAIRLSPVMVPAIAVMTDPDGKDYVWLVEGEEPRAHRRDIRIGRFAGSDQVQVQDGLTGGEQVVVAGVMQLAEGRRVRLWDDREAGKDQ